MADSAPLWKAFAIKVHYFPVMAATMYGQQMQDPDGEQKVQAERVQLTLWPKEYDKKAMPPLTVSIESTDFFTVILDFNVNDMANAESIMPMFASNGYIRRRAQIERRTLSTTDWSDVVKEWVMDELESSEAEP